MRQHCSLDTDVAIEPYANLHEASLQLPKVIVPPDESYHTGNRRWQGIPTVERISSGSMFSAWYSGGRGEGVGNYVALVRSDDNGRWFVVYDRERNDGRDTGGAGEILLADFTEEEVLAGKLLKRTSRLKLTVDRLRMTKKKIMNN